MLKVLRTLTITVYALVFFAGATFFLYVQGFPPFARIMTVSEIGYSLGPWNGLRVRVRGQIEAIMSIPEDVPTYRYVLKDPDVDVYIRLTWPNGDLSKVPLYKIVTVVGVVTEGQTRTVWPWKTEILPLLKAETIEV